MTCTSYLCFTITVSRELKANENKFQKSMTMAAAPHWRVDEMTKKPVWQLVRADSQSDFQSEPYDFHKKNTTQKRDSFSLCLKEVKIG